MVSSSFLYNIYYYTGIIRSFTQRLWKSDWVPKEKAGMNRPKIDMKAIKEKDSDVCTEPACSSKIGNDVSIVMCIKRASVKEKSYLFHDKGARRSCRC